MNLHIYGHTRGVFEVVYEFEKEELRGPTCGEVFARTEGIPYQDLRGILWALVDICIVEKMEGLKPDSRGIKTPAILYSMTEFGRRHYQER